MIKFFRKIRQQLLSQNRFSKYLLYAIGEILLVVIGILIALQVNNWNNYRNELHKEDYYLGEILDNLKSDTLNMNRILDFNKRKRASIDSAAKELGSIETPANRLMAIGRRYNMLSQYYIFEPNSIGFNNMMSAENIELIQNDSIRGILSYYYGFDYAGYRQQKHKETSEAFLDYYNDTYMSKEFVKALYNIDVDLTSDYDLEIWNDPKIYSYFFSMSSLMGFQDLLMEEKKKTVTTLINLIIKEKSLN